MKTFNSVYKLTLIMAAACVLHAQSLVVDKTSLSFSAQFGGGRVSQSVNVSSSGGSTPFFLAPNQSWLTVSPANGNTPSPVTVTADPTSLQPGTYSGSITVFGGTGTNQPIQVSFTVSTIGVSTQTVQFAYQIGGNLPNAQNVTVTGQATGFTATPATSSGGNWLQSQTNGVAPGTVTVLLNQSVVTTLTTGTYSGTITVTPSNGAPVIITVTLTVSPTPPVTLSATSITFDYQNGGTNNQTQQALTITTTGTAPLSYSITPSVTPNPAGKQWLTTSPSSGTIPANGNTSVTVTYDPSGLPSGSYSGSLTISTPGGSPAQQTVQVTLVVSALPLLYVPSGTLNFTYEIGSTPGPSPQTFTASSTAVATNATTGQLPLTVAFSPANSWLSVSPTSNVTTGMAITVTVNPTGMAVGTYNGTITLTGSGAGNGQQTVPVVLTVANDPVPQATPGSLTFVYETGQAAPGSQTVALSTSNGAPLNYTAVASSSTCGGSWLGAFGNSTGSTPNTFTVSVNPGGIAAGTCTGSVVVNATVPATGATAVGSPITIPVTLYVSNSPMVVVSLPGNPPAPPVFTATVGGAAPARQAITLTSTDPTVNLSYTVAFSTASGGNSWLAVTPLAGSTSTGNNTVFVSVFQGLLSAGTYTGTVTITATLPNGNPVADSPVTIPITFQVTQGTLTVSPATLSFTQASGGSAPAAQTIQVTNSNAQQAINYSVTASNTGSGSVTWLSVNAASGATPGTVNVNVDGSKLSPGQYSGTVTITAPNTSGSPAVIPVALTVTAGTISIPANTSLSFTQAAGGSAPAAQTVAVSGTPGPINFTVSTTTQNNGTWLTAAVGSASSGTTPASVSVSVNAGTLPVGTYTGSVTITAPGAAGSPLTIPVTLNVVTGQSLAVSQSSLSFNYVVGTQAPQPQTVQVTSATAAPVTVTATMSNGSNWLQAVPASGTTPVTVTVTTTPQSLAPGTYTGAISIASPSAPAPATVNVTLTVVAIPTPVILAIKNAASYASGAVAPGENIVIGGTGIGPTTLAGLQLTSGGTVATQVAGTQVLFDSVAAPIVYVSSTQTSVMVPFEISGRATTQVQVVYMGVASTPVTYNVVQAQPGIYSLNLMGTGPGAIVNQDNSVNGPSNGAPASSYVAVYLTGMGETTPGGTTGGVAPGTATGQKMSRLPVSATVAGIPSPAIAYAGTAPDFVEGVIQVNLQIPSTAPSGADQLVITFGVPGSSSAFSTQAGITVQVH